MKLFSLLTTLMVSAVFGGYFVPHVANWALDPHTRLGLFEGRIAGLSLEAMRRIPELRVNFQTFKACAQQADCDPQSILEERDQILAARWPQLFDRLAVFADWGERVDSLDARTQFFRTINEVGVDMLRNRCVPIIVYRKIQIDRGPYATYAFLGFRCNEPQPDPPVGLIFYLSMHPGWCQHI